MKLFHITILYLLIGVYCNAQNNNDFCSKINMLIQASLYDFDLMINEHSVVKRGLMPIDTTLPNAFSTYIDLRARQLNPSAPPKYVSFVRCTKANGSQNDEFTFDKIVSKLIACIHGQHFEFTKKKREHIEISIFVDPKTQVVIVVETLKSPMMEPYLSFKIFKNSIRSQLMTDYGEAEEFCKQLNDIVIASRVGYKTIKGKRFDDFLFDGDKIFRSILPLHNMSNERLIKREDDKNLRFVSTYYMGEDSTLARLHYNRLTDIMETFNASGKVEYESVILKEDQVKYTVFKAEDIMNIDRDFWLYFTNISISINRDGNYYKVELSVYLS